MKDFLCIGHRGARGLEPENTLRSIRRALELGAGAVEIDVYAVDGQLVVIHDDTLERTTNGTGRVEAQSFDHLRSLDAGRGEKIPTLGEVLDMIDRHAILNIELKGRHTAAPVAEMIADYVDNCGWRREDILVSSFHIDELQKLAQHTLRLGALFTKPPADYAAITASLGAYSIHLAAKHADAAFVDDAHSHGLKVFVYTVNTIAEIWRIRDIGADGVFTDYPDRFHQAFDIDHDHGLR